MQQSNLSGWVIAFVALSSAGCAMEVAQAGPPPVPAQEQPEVLTRGPVHEAFAEPVNLEFQAGVVAPIQPPANIEEIPPAQRPEGDHYVWVPGYWPWDSDRNNYVWVSACWRVAPPDMSWVPGYWAAVTGGWEWVAGFWTPAAAQEIEYLPAPPAAEDVRPPGAAPSADHIWVPPCQYWNQDRYTPRPGYWLAAQPGWVWAPSHYVRTPRGYVFCAGHWDYALEDRGVLFAPVYLPRSVYGQADFTYSPSIVIDPGVLSSSLFAYPRYNHYYFGDYYDDAYVRMGIYPRFEGERMRTWYDPIYQYDRWHNRRNEPRWEERERHDYDVRRADTSLRPARTYRDMETRLARVDEPGRKSIRMAQPLTAVVANRATAIKFEPINTGARQKIAKQATEVHQFRDQRNQWESTAANPKRAQLPTEHKATVTPPAEHRQPVAVPTDRHPVTPPVEHRQPVTPPTEHRQPVAVPTERQPVAPLPEHKLPVAPPAERRQPAAVPTERKAQPVAPREDHATQAERVKIPAARIVGKPAAQGTAGKGPPARPADEHKAPAEVRDTGKDEAKNKGK